ncbi:Uncharacterised protein [Mycobacterium tuberculosis]|uniref:Uncharacterized protein n=1 Tax=Mycobacterium tuberculosis TaxID=1773 RepID=A0A916PBT3_MYCTX|nr:Uncharacterised protein [Mycobacterium tuberculosis]CPA71952.1 Uncharacterised protein [Mycobacterium tuberculosis]
MFSRPSNVILFPLAATIDGTRISIIRKNGSAMYSPSPLTAIHAVSG